MVRTIALALLVACAGSGSDPCDGIAGSSWQSVDELECGLTLDGTALCHWSLSFAADGTFSWQYSDIGDSGTWTCADGVITGDASGGPVEGTLDGDALTWDDVAYEQL